MKIMIRWLAAIKKSIQKIKLVDRCLILFMMILMAQSTYSLFTNESHSQETGSIDIMVRTTSAAIFGYFLSVNFIKRPAGKTGGGAATSAAPTIIQDKRGGAGITGQIGFTTNSKAEPPIIFGVAESITDELLEESETSQLQIIIATVIGVFALCVLILIRNFSAISPAMLATISQMRDFVSGCVGFLLGSPGTDTKHPGA